MRKKIIVRAPVLTRSGYGEHGRFVLRALRQVEDDYDIYLYPVSWGQCGWIYEDNDERRWLDSIIKKTAHYQQTTAGKPHYDLSVQVTIPNEWEQLASVNVGVTAGIETNKTSPSWIQRLNLMDRVITISNHSKNIFLDSVFDAHNRETGEKATLKCNKDLSVVHYPVKKHRDVELDLNLSTDFNFLSVAQWGPRKNLENTIRWFVEEFIDNPDVGLVVKTFVTGNSRPHRDNVEKKLSSLLEKYKNRKCKIYFLYGDMSDQELHSLYKHPKIKALVSLSHGEGFGLPLFEAAYSALPVIAPEWSGHVDFLCAPKKNKKTGKLKIKPHFAKVDYDLAPVQKEAIWPGVIEEGSMWCYPQQGSYKMKLREVYKEHSRFKSQSKKLQQWILDEFNEKKQTNLLLEGLLGEKISNVASSELPRVSIITSVYDGDEFIEPFLEDITNQTIFEEKCELILVNAASPGSEEGVINKYLEKYPDNIVYKKLDKDPGIYGTWNYALEFATGEYITNANLDDRKAPNSLEKHAKTLFSNEDIDLVYADSFITNKPNETYDNNTSEGRRYNFENFSKEAMLRGNQPHNNPMWRKSLHDKNGYFDKKYKSAGDWEFFLRCAFAGSKFKKLENPLGLYYFNPKGISTNFENFSWKQEEEQEIYNKYKTIAENV